MDLADRDCDAERDRIGLLAGENRGKPMTRVGLDPA